MIESVLWESQRGNLQSLSVQVFKKKKRYYNSLKMTSGKVQKKSMD